MTDNIFRTSRPFCLAAAVFGASLISVQAGTVSSNSASTQIQKPIILAQAKHDNKTKKASKKSKPAQKKNAAKEKNSPWVVQCGKDSKTGKKFCRMQQSLRFKKTGQRLLSVVIQPQTIEPKLAILLSLPHGLYLPAGAAYKVDDGEKNNLVIETCDVQGCYASGGLTKKQIAEMKRGKNLLVGFLSSTKKSITIPVTLSGFSASYKKISQNK